LPITLWWDASKPYRCRFVKHQYLHIFTNITCIYNIWFVIGCAWNDLLGTQTPSAYSEPKPHTCSKKLVCGGCCTHFEREERGSTTECNSHSHPYMTSHRYDIAMISLCGFTSLWHRYVASHRYDIAMWLHIAMTSLWHRYVASHRYMTWRRKN